MISHLRLPISRLLAMVLIFLLCPVPELVAQAATTQAAPAITALHINILDGEGALNNISQRTAREPIIQVEDQNHKPVAGALVVFAIHSSGEGAGGTFVTPFAQSSTLSVTTDAEGKAVAHGLTPNSTAGQFTMSAQASAGGVSTSAVMHLANSLLGGASTGSSASSNAASNSTSVSSNATSTSATSTGSGAGSAGAGAGAAGGAATHGVFHLFHLLPKWAVVGVAGGAATVAVVTVVVIVAGSSSANISAGTGTVTGPH